MGKSKSFFDQLKQRLRIVLFDEQSYEELESVSLTRFQLFIRILSVLFLICSLTVLIIAFTPLREFIPGYSPSHLSKNLINLSLKTDSLLTEIQIKDQKFKILEKVVRGEAFNDSVFYDSSKLVVVDEEALKASSQDSVFREAIEREGRFNVLSELEKKPSELQSDHFGVDVVAPENEAIKACLPGTIVLANWTTETGYTLVIQHENDLISTYKHNSVLLKKVGSIVKAGDVIAIIGNSGRLSTGPHLHFELWHKGKAINPEHHILF